ncbi:MAG: SagB/ThcOx family dehydrogenase [Armatimonadota bacterium]
MVDYKRYPEALEVIRLPKPQAEGGEALWQVIARRRSERDYRAEPLALDQLSQLLWATQGITGRIEGYELRASPSAGALYPCETYLVVNRVSGLRAGLYHYVVPDHALERLKEADLAHGIADACWGQQMCARAGAVFVWSAVIERCRWKYGERAFRYIYLDAGHIGAQLHLACVALGLGCCAIGAFNDDKVNELVGLDGEEEFAIYLSSVGNL